ncbi:hypothetical protein FC72_GL000208 [Companilactobacillus tucceti DSM 20183]|uniref:HTH tetR-type domain-containing protein n=1 Tax=Companilactobacillus tucceti DSM 20183 TaxID=1423811 RepID=A0A0R1J9T4_9LACO|nr:TetR/AcrR family transcriptional regulator [Companilactobacillus tucceti]KRK65763.1 hypothetical protein FC72_GL000208 [Companilactobacillus tucceti DSM 20183]
MVQKRDLSKQRIIQTAKNLISDSGSQAATFASIAKALDCRTQALYFYFKNRDELNQAIAQNYLLSLKEVLKTECLGYSGKNGLIKMAKVMREYGLNNLSLSILTMESLNLSTKESYKNIVDINSMMRVFMKGFVQDSAKEMTITRGIRGLVIGEVVSESVGMFHNPLVKNTQSFEENLHKIIG